MAAGTNVGVRIDSGDAVVTLRANACLALARAFDRPDAWAADLGEFLVEACAAPGEAMVDDLHDMAEEMTNTETLSVAHAKLFLGPFAVQAAPWASFYLDPEQRLMGPFSRYAAEAYAEAGLGPRGDANDAPDHVTRELEFMYYLAFQEAITGDPVWLQRQRRFWHEHLARWLPKLADAMEAAEVGGTFYACFGRLVRAFCAWESCQLGGSVDSRSTGR